MNPEIYKQYIKQVFCDAALAFADNPSEAHWYSLKVAMWAWQLVQGLPTDQAKNVALQHLVDLAEQAKGDCDFGEP